MARELDKLALFLDAAPDRPQPLTMSAIDALGADWGEAAVGALVAAVIDGEPAALGSALDQAAGSSPVPWLRALGRRLATLAAMRAELARGDTADAVMKRHRVFSREEHATLAALRRWSPSMLAQAQARVLAAERAATAPGTAGAVTADRVAIALARAARR